jgi:predicted ATP-grasp superfamily ATP-dependent carboligase
VTTVPAVNDADSNGVLDSTDVAAATAAVVAAEQAYQAAKDALTTANTDGLINPAEKAALEQAKADAEAAKAAAQAKVDALPSTEQTELQGRLDDLNTTVPAVNDADSNGVLDSTDVAAATAAVVAAEQAYQAAKDALTTANTDGLINPAEKAALEQAKADAEAAKAAAQAKVDALPSTEQTELQGRLDDLNTTVPAVNDADSNGVLDSTDVAAATAAVVAAEQAYQAAKDALTTANTDGLINPAEKAALEQAKADAEAAKAAAQAKVDALPSTEQTELQGRLDDLNTTVPAVNDADSNGVLDSTDVAAATAAVVAAEQAYQAAKDALTTANTDGLINPAEKAALEQAKADAEAAKAAAQAKVDALPSTEQTELQGRLDDLNTTVPAVNDADSNGVLDSTDVAAATAAVVAAEQAYQAAKDALTTANTDGLINPAEKAALEQAKADAEAAKAAAQAKVDALPSTEQTELQGRLDDLNTTVPAVNDADSNGVLDSTDVAAATAAVVAAEQAYQAAKDALTTANTDGLINPAEKAALEQAKADAEAAKAAAQAKVDALPSTEQTELQGRLDDLNTTVPAVNDADSNGVLDSTDVAAATAAVVAAEQAYQAAKDALTTANTDGLINPAEKAALEQAKADAEAAKAAAQAKVDALPSTEQTELQGRLDDLNTTVPAVNDADSNGVLDSTDVAAATAAVVAAEQAYQAAKDALTTANTDGLINPAEKAALEQAKADAEAAKAAAQAKVDALPSTEQTELQGRLDDLNTTVPAVNDADSNGVLDSTDVAAATAAVVAAEQAYQAAKDALTTANTDGLINPAEKAALEQAKADAEAAKAAAQAKVDALPSTEQTELQGRLDDLNTTVPAVNDADSNGVLDSTDVAAATAAVVAAEQAYQAAKDALTTANTDGLINPAEKAALEQAKADAEAAKAAAQAKVDALPSTEQTELQGRLDDLNTTDYSSCGERCGQQWCS